ncbi:MAG: hypothetical protein JSS83_27135 [Cyanobacteria bacterium SZAS LIN-3]|nr:hypothetical protein [Cyanobacteria bacterium SZAS LIN-3]
MRLCTKYGALTAVWIACAIAAFFALPAPAEPLTDGGVVLDLTAAARHERILQFPADYSLGEVLIRAYPPDPKRPDLRGAARGKVVVPANCMVRFIPSRHFYKNPAIVKTISPDGIDSLELTASSVFDGDEGLCDRALAHIGHLKSVVELSVDRSDASDKGLVHAAELPNLQKVSAFSADVEGGSLKELAACKKLRILRLPRLSLNDDCLQYLSRLPRLEYVVLTRSNITDRGVRHLSNCPGLVSLCLADNPRVTDQSIPSFLKLQKLRYLILGDTSITGTGLLSLKALPLQVLELPRSEAGIANLHELRKALSGVSLRPPVTHKKLDPDTKTILAPLH